MDATRKSPKSSLGTLAVWLLGIASFGLLALIIVAVVIRFLTPSNLPRLQLMGGIALPGVLATAGGQLSSQSLSMDRFDFEALDEHTGYLFIAHPGPTATKLALLQQAKEVPAGLHVQSSVAVFNTRSNKYMGAVLAPFVHGIAVAPDLQRVYAADADEGKIYVIDEHSCKDMSNSNENACRVLTTIKTSGVPDSLEYDATDHEVFISEPGKANPDQGLEEVISTQTNAIIHVIKWGTDVGHVRYDPLSRRVFVVLVSGTQSEIATVNPVTFTINRVALPKTCVSAHGLILDSRQQVAFAACVDSQNVAMFDMRALKPIGDTQNLLPVGSKPDVLAVDTDLHVLYIGCASAVSVFEEQDASHGVLHKLKDYVLNSGSTHSIAVDEQAHDLYVPLTSLGGRPALLIEHYNQQGNV
ncbi:hypothetical protein EPA93_41900 [Ktedonosporobacter rubrisoli]|uniref:YncE family protein n=1 Tax=Ktedonosporobacter rubrisoli TaxID=2509675 RepID=A0A4P6K1X7_KTERU|nr:hypothetical protein [Ktedonosporobacter rubrisoli]QBD82188.1 hypothetical protein EPA93_41900 [Ktedonosporobacter rubrisoli]